jgi:hypothetical protein
MKMKMEQQIKCPHMDAFGSLFRIGDLILIAKNSSMVKAYVLGWTPAAIIVSCERVASTYYKTAPVYYVRDTFEHNDKQSITVYTGAQFYVLSSGGTIPENLQKFIKRGQLQEV